MTGASINIMENLDLRAFLERQQVTTVVMEATGDFWKPFYSVLEDTCRFSWSMPRTHEISLAERLMCPMRHGWPNWPACGLLRASFVPRDHHRGETISRANRDTIRNT
jgi:hypothetical protein